MLNIHLLHELTTTQSITSTLYTTTQTTSFTLLLFYNTVNLFFLCVGGNGCVLFVCCAVLFVLYNCEIFLTSILDCMSSKNNYLWEVIAECSASKWIYYLLVHSRERETRAHQGWILDLMIRVDQTKPPCVFFHSASTLWFSDVRVQYPDWLNMYVWLTASVSWSTGGLRVHLLLTCLCVFLLSDQSFSQPSPASPPPTPKTKHNTCIVIAFYLRTRAAGRSPSSTLKSSIAREEKQTFHWTLFLWHQCQLDRLCWPFSTRTL